MFKFFSFLSAKRAKAIAYRRLNGEEKHFVLFVEDKIATAARAGLTTVDVESGVHFTSEHLDRVCEIFSNRGYNTTWTLDEHYNFPIVHLDWSVNDS